MTPRNVQIQRSKRLKQEAKQWNDANPIGTYVRTTSTVNGPRVWLYRTQSPAHEYMQRGLCVSIGYSVPEPLSMLAIVPAESVLYAVFVYEIDKRYKAGRAIHASYAFLSENEALDYLSACVGENQRAQLSAYVLNTHNKG
jgi:hypothetical protein